MSKLTAVLVALTCLGCSVQKPSSSQGTTESLAGTYVAWLFINGTPFAGDGVQGTTQKLTLTEKGTYSYVVATNVMVKLSVKAEGNYIQSGGIVTLTGTQTSSMDDGYKKSNDSGAHNMSLKVENNTLTTETPGVGTTYFRKVGSGPPPLPTNLKLRPSDASATALIGSVEDAYGALKSVRITGTVKSQGAGFVAEDAKFKILFQRPTKFRFEAILFDRSHVEFDRTELTWDGGKTCWWYTKEFGEKSERSPGNALSMSNNFGPEAYILPSLLLPNELGGFDFKTMNPEMTVLAEETFDGKECTVLKLRGKDGTATKLWIDKSTKLIAKYYEEIGDVTLTFQSEPNVTIPAAEFNFGKRSSPGKS